MQPNIQDKLKCKENKKLKEYLSGTEEILFSNEVIKVNKNRRRQKREILLTSENFYNLSNNILTKIFSGNTIKRKIPLNLIGGIVYARMGNEFIIRVPDQFDYRIVSSDKDLIIEQLLYAIKKSFGIESLPFHFTDEVELYEFCTHRSEKKKGIIRTPVGKSRNYSLEAFRDFLREKYKINNETEVVVGSKKKVTLNDFDLLLTLGKGGFGKVYLAMKKDTQELFALKAIRKAFVIEKNQFEQVRREKEILHDASHPFQVGLTCAFQTVDKLFLLMPFIQGGDLFMHLKRRKRFTESEVQFFVSQIILALQFQHTKGIVYQDLKPENILLNHNGYIKLADFGAAKYCYQTKNYKTFIGTADYIAPEVLRKMPYNKGVDWWSVGILMFELLYGKTPFFQQDPRSTFKHILTDAPHFPKDNYISIDCKDFILRCLSKDPEKRIGYKDDLEQLEHQWFDNLDTDKQLNYEYDAPMKPEITSETDCENFNPKHTQERPKMTLMTEDLINMLKKHDPMFAGFYAENEEMQENRDYLDFDEKFELNTSPENERMEKRASNTSDRPEMDPTLFKKNKSNVDIIEKTQSKKSDDNNNISETKNLQNSEINPIDTTNDVKAETNPEEKIACDKITEA